MPSNRDSATTWTDSSGNLWLFGGNGFDSAGKPGYMNDFWEYNSSPMHGLDGRNQYAEWAAGCSGTAGTLGTPAARNIPGARYSSSGWTDSKGNFWLFGGYKVSTWNTQ